MRTRFTNGWRKQHVRCIRITSIAIMLAAIGACTSQTDTNSPPGTRLTSPSTDKSMGVSAAELAGRKAAETYTAMWMTMAEAAETANWQSPRLSQHATGIALNTISRGIYIDHTNGHVTRGRPTLFPTVTDVEPVEKPVRVRISDCGDSTHWLKYDATTGQLVDAEPGGRRAISAVVDKQDDSTWRVSDFAVRELGSC